MLHFLSPANVYVMYMSNRRVLGILVLINVYFVSSSYYQILFSQSYIRKGASVLSFTKTRTTGYICKIELEIFLSVSPKHDDRHNHCNKIRHGEAVGHSLKDARLTMKVGL